MSSAADQDSDAEHSLWLNMGGNSMSFGTERSSSLRINDTWGEEIAAGVRCSPRVPPVRVLAAGTSDNDSASSSPSSFFPSRDGITWGGGFSL